MILNSKNNQFVFYFPPDFWGDDIKNQYDSFRKSLLLPYDSIDDYILSTLQSLTFPGWKMDLSTQNRYLGLEQTYKSAEPVKDLITKQFRLTFKTTEGFMNYSLFWYNAINYVNHSNPKNYFNQMIVGLLNNEGYLMQTITFKKVIMTGMSDYSLDYSNIDNSFNKFSVDFVYNTWEMNLVFDKMINLYEND